MSRYKLFQAYLVLSKPIFHSFSQQEILKCLVSSAITSVQFLEDLPHGGPPLLPLAPPTIKPPSIHLLHTQQSNCASERHSVCPTLCDPTDCTVHGILQARILEWVAVPFSRASSKPRDGTQVSHIAGGFLTSWATREAQLHQRNSIIQNNCTKEVLTLLRKF